jgi:flagellin-like hook-associated protein FlgL
MSSIIPIPTTRVGDYFVRQRLIGQTQTDQLDLFKLQTQISTGQRLQYASDDAPAALRAINLQRLLDRKGQIKTNVAANKLFLSTASAQLDGDEGAASILMKLRASVIGVSGTLTSEKERQAAIGEVDGALNALVNAGNATSQGRYLFSGSRTQVQPYDYNGQYVEYFGNEGTLKSYVDIERLFDTNLAGTDVFGGISNKLQGGDLNPHLSADTLLSTVNGGTGIGRNAAITLTVNNGTSTVSSVVDLSKAITIGDVARYIEQASPSGTKIVATVTGTGLSLQITNPPGGSIAIGEVAQGRTASELGILTPYGATATPTINGANLDPVLLNTTRLNSLLGTKAQARLVSPAADNNDIVLTSNRNGAAYNDTHIVFVHDSAAATGATATYDGTTLTVHILSGITKASDVVNAINAEATGAFTAAVDYRDATAAAQAGTNPVQATDFGTIMSGGDGENLDLASGLTITNGGKSSTLDTSNVKTVEDLLNLINRADVGVVAEINADRTGINVRSRLSGADLTIGENGGQLATQLGIRSYTGDSKLAGFNRGLGIQSTDTLEPLDTSKLDSLQIVARNGTTLNVSLTGATSLQDVVNAINGAVGNTAPTAVSAQLSQNGNRIELVDSSTPSSGSLVVQSVPGTQAAEYLGFVDPGETSKSATGTDSTGASTLSGGNVLGNDLVIQARDGTELWIDLAGAKTVDDVLKRINENPANTGLPPKITAQLATNGNGIQLVDTSVGGGTLKVRSVEGSQAAEYLGFVKRGETESPDPTAGPGGTSVLQSEDRNTIESDSVFNTLVRLKQALEDNNIEEIGRTIDRLDTDINRVNFARADIGSRVQSLETIGTKLEDENVQLRSALSDDTEVDLVEAISNMTARQYALQASLQTAGSILQLSLLDFI